MRRSNSGLLSALILSSYLLIKDHITFLSLELETFTRLVRVLKFISDLNSLVFLNEYAKLDYHTVYFYLNLSMNYNEKDNHLQF